MKNQVKIAIISGVFLIIAAFGCLMGLFYFMGQENNRLGSEIARLEIQLNDIIFERAEAKLKEGEVKRIREEVKRPQPVTVEDLVEKSESLYTEEEIKRREGILWIDRKTPACIITLGAINGLRQGSYLTIFKDQQKIGQIVVETPFDIISYVRPVQLLLSDLPDDYYHVVIE